MYTQLLEAVLAYEADPDTQPRSQGPLADVVRLRHTLERHAARTDPGWALQAVADQLAYDAALIRLARKRGIPIGAGGLRQPRAGPDRTGGRPRRQRGEPAAAGRGRAGPRSRHPGDRAHRGHPPPGAQVPDASVFRSRSVRSWIRVA